MTDHLYNIKKKGVWTKRQDRNLWVMKEKIELIPAISWKSFIYVQCYFPDFIFGGCFIGLS